MTIEVTDKEREVLLDVIAAGIASEMPDDYRALLRAVRAKLANAPATAPQPNLTGPNDKGTLE